MFKTLLVLFSFCFTWSAQLEQQNSKLFQQTQIGDVEKLISKFNETFNLPSLVLGFSLKGQSVWKKAYGYSELENQVPVKLTTRFRLASISKTFTSGIIGTLVDRVLLSYEDPLSKYLDESIYPTKKWKNTNVNITIAQLLSHTAGTHVTAESDFKTLYFAPNVTDSIRFLKQEDLLFEPGTRFSYSNYGFQLLGAVIEFVTKKTYPQVVTEFFHQHELNSSLVERPELLIPERARYYTFSSPNATRENIPSELDQLVSAKGDWPSGGLVSTVDDLMHWGNLMIDSYKGKKDSILTQKTVKQMWSSHTTNLPGFPHNRVHDSYGLGWAVTHRNQTENPGLKHPNYYWHSGGLPGVTTMLFVYPEEEIVAVALTNKGGGINLDDLLLAVVEKLF